nr:4Fe-4S dicluster domain-containing protein [Spirochaetota bacterium]
WGCWTAFILDFFPYKENITWKKGKYKHLRYLSFFFSLAVVLILFIGFGYVIHSADNESGANINLHAVYWFAAGNILYYLAGIILAVKMKDNRAFCKYICPASIFLKNFSRISVLKIKGNKDKCTACGACTKACPSGILISEYVKNGERIKSTECMMCMKCIPACPHGILGVSAGLDFSIKDRLKTR